MTFIHTINFISLLSLQSCLFIAETPLTMEYLTDVTDADAQHSDMVCLHTLTPLLQRPLTACQKICMHNLQGFFLSQLQT